ncbi:fructose-specific phosphotransferase system IIC component [Paenibacillus eucommiae]|uniref:Fructose-specific phosphotransferase system IIC component n=1 Tax=Paenibacillus eucommiae TaxID=1355755 RepID=A0ABS4IR76_9BACL|nr:fructose-specific phosphotransferase system IIC component [Paenibacillus eucommiae]
MIQRIFKVGIWLILLTYLALMIIGFFRGSLTGRTGFLMTLIAGAIVGILYWLPKLYAYLNRWLYEELKRMMK